MKQGYPLSSLIFNVVSRRIRSSTHCKRARKLNKGIDQKEKKKTFLFADNIVVYVKYLEKLKHCIAQCAITNVETEIITIPFIFLPKEKRYLGINFKKHE